MTGTIDLVTLGRINLDLFSQDIGADFEDITGFDAMAGGSPANIAIGASRLGSTTAMLSKLGKDRVGDLNLRYMDDEGVDITHIGRVEGKLSSLALLGVQPPSNFPLSFYRDDPADIYLTVGDVERFHWDSARALQISGNALSRGPCVDAAFRAAELAGHHGLTVYADLDLRPTEWTDPSGFGNAQRRMMRHLDVVIGTEEEFHAAFMPDPARVMDGSRVSGDETEDLDAAVGDALSLGPRLMVIKRGPRGASLIDESGITHVPGFRVDPVNTVGAGDSFASAFINRSLLGWEPGEATQFANAAGAITVTRHGCSAALPTEEEVSSFLERYRVAT